MILEVLILNMAIMRPKQRVRLSQQSKVNESIGNFILETDHMWKWYQCYILNLSHLHIKLHFKGLILFLTARVCVCLCVCHFYVKTCRCVASVDAGVVSSLQKPLEPLNSNYGYWKLQEQSGTLPVQLEFWTSERSYQPLGISCFKFIEIRPISELKRYW